MITQEKIYIRIAYQYTFMLLYWQNTFNS